MPNNTERSSKRGRNGRLTNSPSPEHETLPATMTSSQALGNASMDSSTQFNADVGRRTTTSYSQDVYRIEDSSFQDGQGRNNFHFNFAHSIPHYGPATGPTHLSTATSTLNNILPNNYVKRNSNAEIHRSESSAVILDSPQRPSNLPTPTSGIITTLPTPAANDLAQTDEETINAIQRRISDIFILYETLPRKLARFKRRPGLDSLRKDLNAQKAMLLVTVENGELMSCLERTLKQSLTASVPVSQTAPPLNVQQVIDIQSRLHHIHKQLTDVDTCSDGLASQQDKITLTIRQRRDAIKPTSSVNMGRGGRVSKRRQSSGATRQLRLPPKLLPSLVAMVTAQIDEFQRQCQRLQPPLPGIEIEVTDIPQELQLTKAVAVMLCKALCQVCPNEKHVHQVLFGLSTPELPRDNGRDAGIEFNLAIECPEEHETTWFVVKSTRKDQDDEEMTGNHSYTTETARPAQVSNDLSNTTTEPEARFCLQYYKQGTDDRAMTLRHSDLFVHELFYPNQARLDFIKDTGRAVSLRQMLEEGCFPMQRLEMLPKVRLARMLAEAVLKFYSADWLSCKWDWNNVLIHEINGSLEPHLRFELRSPGSTVQDLEGNPSSQTISRVLAQLAILLRYIAIGANAESATYGIVRDNFSSVYAEIIETCSDLSKSQSNLGDQDIQERFYATVVAKFEELEEFLIEHELS